MSGIRAWCDGHCLHVCPKTVPCNEFDNKPEPLCLPTRLDSEMQCLNDLIPHSIWNTDFVMGTVSAGGLFREGEDEEEVKLAVRNSSGYFPESIPS